MAPIIANTGSRGGKVTNLAPIKGQTKGGWSPTIKGSVKGGWSPTPKGSPLPPATKGPPTKGSGTGNLQLLARKRLSKLQ